MNLISYETSQNISDVGTLGISYEAGTIFNIQKFSLHDGPGIRTVVFFKGCPLSCKWCSNPESQDTKCQILWDRDKCSGCKSCITLCPAQAVSDQEGRLSINARLCRGCMTCISHCPHQALKAEGKTKTVKEILDICLQDEAFYEESGGGVTLSGGEVLMQPEFAFSLLKALKGRHIHTAIETTGYADTETFRKVIRYADLLLFDIKHWEEHTHLEGTGVSNSRILANMKDAIDSGKNVLPRLPVIPGYNDSLRDAEGFAGCLRQAGAKEVQLLPFHQFGEKKYDMLDRAYAYTDIPALHEEDLEDFKEVFVRQGIRAFF